MTRTDGPIEGEMVGPYRLIKQIGYGSNSRVFEARDTRSDTTRAFKLFFSPRPGDGFVREAGVGFQLHHPNLLAVHDVGYLRGAIRYMVFDLAEGGSLRSRLADGPVAVRFVRHVVVELARALGLLHQSAIVHRDLKPENILLSGPELLARVRLGDLGAAERVRGELAQGDIGSPAYMAPEQAEGACDTRADVYALGVLAYEMLAGRRPFVGSPREVLDAHLTREPDWTPLPDEVAAVLRRALAKAPDARTSTPYALARELDLALDSDRSGVVVPLDGVSPDEPLAQDVSAGWSVARRQGRLAFEGPDAPADASTLSEDEHAALDAATLPRLALRNGERLRLGIGADAVVVGCPLYGLPPLVALGRYRGDAMTVEGPPPSLVWRSWDGSVTSRAPLPFVLAALVAVAGPEGECVVGVDAQRSRLVVIEAGPYGAQTHVLELGARVSAMRTVQGSIHVTTEAGRPLMLSLTRGAARLSPADSGPAPSTKAGLA